MIISVKINPVFCLGYFILNVASDNFEVKYVPGADPELVFLHEKDGPVIEVYLPGISYFC